MRKYILIFSISTALVAALVLIAYTQLEIYTRTKRLPPSREAAENIYFVLDKWLEETGRPVRVQDWGNIYTIIEAEEKTVFVQASLFDWYEKDWTELLEWVEAGGVLLISLDDRWYDEEEGAYEEFLAELGIWRDRSDPYEYVPDSREDMEPRPSFDRDAAFIVDELGIPETEQDISGGTDAAGRAARGMQVMTGNDDKIRLVSLAWDQGRITVTGRPIFTRSWNLKSPENIGLTWNLFKNDTFAFQNTDRSETSEANKNAGVLFIRGDKPKDSLFGRLFERGDFMYLIISGLLLIGIGLWMALPGFGFPLPENETPLKPIRERFLAEAGFLKKHQALDMYRSMYIQEVKQRLFSREGFIQDEDIPRRIAHICADKLRAGDSAAMDIEKIKEVLTMYIQEIKQRYFQDEDFIRDKDILPRIAHVCIDKLRAGDSTVMDIERIKEALTVYIQEIKQRYFRGEDFIRNKDILPRIARICIDKLRAGDSTVMDIERIKEALTMNKRYRGKEFVKDIITLKTILERL